MIKNIGTIERVIRVVLALVFAYFGFTISAWFYLLTAFALITAAIGYCPLYHLLGISTNKK
jgi:hypothetical protein